MIHRRWLTSLVLLLGVFVCTGTALAETEEIGQIKTLKGEVIILRSGAERAAQPGDLLHKDDVVQTGADSSVGITFIDGSRFAAGPNTRLALKRFRFNPTTQDGEFSAEMKQGTLTVVSGHIAKQSPDAMKIVTPTTILGFRGTTVAVEVSK
jgi:hypothetical protein